MRDDQCDEGVDDADNDGDDDNAATGVASSVQIASMVVMVDNNDVRNNKDNHGSDFDIGVHTNRANDDGACQILGLAGRGDGAGRNDKCCADIVLGISKYVYIFIYRCVYICVYYIYIYVCIYMCVYMCVFYIYIYMYIKKTSKSKNVH